MKRQIYLWCMTLLSSCAFDGDDPLALPQNHATIDRRIAVEIFHVESEPNPLFTQQLHAAILAVLDYSHKNNLGVVRQADFLDEVYVYGTKAAFDAFVLEQPAWPEGQAVPTTFVGVGENRRFHVVAWEVYRRIFPHDTLDDYRRIIIHELAHLLHIAVLNGDEEAMGPRWFYEGWACVVAGQYQSSPLPDNNTIMQSMTSDNLGDYKIYAAIVRRLILNSSPRQLILDAQRADFTDRAMHLVVAPSGRASSSGAN